MVLGHRKTCAKKLSTNNHLQRSGPQGGILMSLGFFLGRLPFDGDHFLTTFLAYVLRWTANIIYNLWDLGYVGDMAYIIMEQPAP